MAQTNNFAKVFAQFAGNEVHKATVEGIGEIQYRTLTIKEADDFQKKLIKGFDSEGKPEINFDEMNTVRNQKIALCLIEPKATVKDLETLGATAGKVLTEIDGLISGTSELEDEEGN